MARVFIILFVLFVFGSLIPENEALNNQSYEIPVPTNGRIQALKGRKCLNFLWDRPCNHPYCKVTLQIKMQNDSSQHAVEIPSYKPVTTDNSASFVQCIYDSSAGENVSCCNSINSEVHLTSGHQERLSIYEKISFQINVCLNDSGNCVTKDEGFDFILPWRNPCFFENPCKNFGVCNPGVDNYDCSCSSDWRGSDCTLLSGVQHRLGLCLNYSSNPNDTLYMATPLECKRVCMAHSDRCKSFEFKKMSFSNYGNCTFHDTNSHNHSLVPCDSDYYEINSSVPIVAVALHLLVMMLAGIFLAEY